MQAAGRCWQQPAGSHFVLTLVYCSLLLALAQAHKEATLREEEEEKEKKATDTRTAADWAKGMTDALLFRVTTAEHNNNKHNKRLLFDGRLLHLVSRASVLSERGPFSGLALSGHPRHHNWVIEMRASIAGGIIGMPK